MIKYQIIVLSVNGDYDINGDYDGVLYNTREEAEKTLKLVQMLHSQCNFSIVETYDNE